MAGKKNERANQRPGGVLKGSSKATKSRGKKQSNVTEAGPQEKTTTAVAEATVPAPRVEQPKPEESRSEATTSPTIPVVDLEALRKPAQEAKAALDVALGEARQLTERAEAIRSQAKAAFATALAPYREACKKAGVTSEFEGGRRSAVSERVSFVVEERGSSVVIAVKGRPETEEVFSLSELNASISKVAYGYTDKHVGPREVVGNKGGTLSNKLRAVLDGAK